MNILKFYEAKAQNRKTSYFLQQLIDDGRAESLPGAMGLHYRKFNPDSPDYSVAYSAVESIGKYNRDLYTCSNALNAVFNPRTLDIRIDCAVHYCRHTRLCAVCGTKEARRVSSQLAYLFERNKKNNYDYYMLTLTLPNNKEGFRKEFEIYNKCLASVLSFCGFTGSKSSDPVSGTYNACEGYFASKELTYTDSKGWHPHVHCILAFKPGALTDVKLSRKGYVKSSLLNRSHKRSLSVDTIMQAFLNAIKRKYPEYYDTLPCYPVGEGDSLTFKKFVNVDFRPITDIENSVDEICKYLIDYRCFNSADTLFTYFSDSFKISKYSKNGCFGWSKAIEKQWKHWLENGKISAESPGNANFMDFREFRYFDTSGFFYFGIRHALHGGKLYSVPIVYRKSECIDNLRLVWNNERDSYEFHYYDERDRKLYHLEYTRKMSNILINGSYAVAEKRLYYYYPFLKSSEDG